MRFGQRLFATALGGRPHIASRPRPPRFHDVLAMPFSFSFSLSLPGITNPFTAQAEALTASASAPALPARSTWEGMDDPDVNRRLTSLPPRRRRRPPSPSLLPPLVKKRGWVPSSSEISEPAPIHTSTSGYLDTPAKYRDLAMGGNDEDEIEEMVAGACLPFRSRMEHHPRVLSDAIGEWLFVLRCHPDDVLVFIWEGCVRSLDDVLAVASPPCQGGAKIYWHQNC